MGRERAVRVLVVDDDEPTRALLSSVLTDEGYTVETAQDGVDALRRLRRYHPSLILLDVGMPRMDGWTFAAAYRQMPGPHAPIIMLTARDTEADEVRGFEAGADDYVSKPFSIPLLTARMQTVLHRYQDSGARPG